MERLLLVRHGETAANRDRVVLGRSLDVPLTGWGHRQAGHAAERVAELAVGACLVLSSDAIRASQTAVAIAERVGAPVEYHRLLREQYLGELEGQPTAGLRPMAVPEGFHITDIGWGGGESIAAVAARLTWFLTRLLARDDLPETVVLVGHGDALCVLQAVIAGRSHREIDWDGDGLALGEVREVDAQAARLRRTSLRHGS